MVVLLAIPTTVPLIFPADDVPPPPPHPANSNVEITQNKKVIALDNFIIFPIGDIPSFGAYYS
jgi:hypothetical protein